MVFYNIYIHWANRHDELPKNVRHIMVSYYGVSKWCSIIYTFIRQIDMTSGPKMLGKIWVQIKSCRNGSLYMYIYYKPKRYD